MIEIINKQFDVTGAAILITATGGQKIHIVGLFLHNNSTTTATRLRTQFEAVSFYGGGSGGFFIKEGFNTGIPISRDSVKYPYFISNANDRLIVQAVNSRVSGNFWYFLK